MEETLPYFERVAGAKEFVYLHRRWIEDMFIVAMYWRGGDGVCRRFAGGTRIWSEPGSAPSDVIFDDSITPSEFDHVKNLAIRHGILTLETEAVEEHRFFCNYAAAFSDGSNHRVAVQLSSPKAAELLEGVFYSELGLAPFERRQEELRDLQLDTEYALDVNNESCLDFDRVADAPEYLYMVQNGSMGEGSTSVMYWRDRAGECWRFARTDFREELSGLWTAEPGRVLFDETIDPLVFDRLRDFAILHGMLTAAPVRNQQHSGHSASIYGIALADGRKHSFYETIGASLPRENTGILMLFCSDVGIGPERGMDRHSWMLRFAETMPVWKWPPGAG